MDAELHFHLDARIADLIVGGMPADAARSRALREFGDVDAVRSGLVAIDSRVARRRGRGERWEWLGHDLRHVVRSLRRSPGFVSMVALTLALGLGVNAAVFSVLDRLFLQPPPGIDHPGQVRRIYRYYRVDTAAFAPARPLGDFTVFAYSDLGDIAALAPAGTRVAGYTATRSQIGSIDDGVEVGGTFVSGDYFAVLGVRPVLGRFFALDETRVQSAVPVAVVSHRLWQARFGGRTDLVGQPIDVDGHRYTIVGVTPERFHGADNDANDVWLPIGAMRWSPDLGSGWGQGRQTGQLKLVARVPSAGAARALERAATLVFRRSDIKADINPVATLRPLMDAAGPDSDGSGVAIATRLAGVSLIILLIACANVGNLLLARGARRRREIAVRVALGVSRRRLIGLLLAESLAVTTLGGVVAILATAPVAAVLRRMLLPEIHWIDPAVNLHVLLFVVLLVLVAGIGAGLVPALQASRPDIAAALKSGAREGTFQRSRLGGALVAAQAALSVVLLTGAGLLVRSLHSMETADIGYDADRVVFASITADANHRERQRAIKAGLPALATELARVPGVVGTGLTSNVPMRSSWAMTVFLPGGDSLVVGVSFVSPTYLEAIGVHVREGRGLTARDSSGASAVLVNDALARKLWPGREAVGQCLVQRIRGGLCVPIVGVAADAREMGIDEDPRLPAPRFYRPLPDSGWGTAQAIALRTSPGRASLVADEVRRVLRARYAGWAVPSVRPMRDNMIRELRPRRVGAMLFSAAGLLALLVAIVGVYSTISYRFSQRVHEIGVRIALGATGRSVIQLVVSEGVRVVLLGVVIGVTLALALGRVVESMLYRTSPHDPAVLSAVSVALLFIAVLACLVPAWRALPVDPAIALRAD